MKNNKKSKISFWQSVCNFIKTNWKTLCLIILMTIFSIGMVLTKLQSFEFSLRSKRALIIFGVLIVLTIVLSIIIFWAKKRNWKIERIYLICGLILGTFYCFCLPVGSVPDEPAHFRRTYAISEGQIIQSDSNASLPENIPTVINAYVKQNAYHLEITNFSIQPAENKKIYDSPNYSILNYLPQTLGVLIGKLFHLPIIPMMLLARFLNMICCVIAIYLCLKYIPVLKKYFSLLLFYQ